MFSGTPYVYANLKYATPISKNLRFGVSFSSIMGFVESPELIGTLNGLLTYGNIDHNITFGTGLAFSENQFETSGILTIAGTTRISNKLALIIYL